MFALLTALFLAAAGHHPAGDPDRPSLQAGRVSAGDIRVDGALAEPAWAAAEVADAFVMRQPDPGATPSERTEARVVVDGAAVYVGMRMFDSQPDAIDARLGRRDVYLETDWARVALGSLADGRTAYQFSVNPAGVQRDALLYDDVRLDYSWDAVWDVAVSRDVEGWTAEFRIPLSQLRFDPADARWGVQFGRDLQRTDESMYWAPWPPDSDGTVSRFGHLDGIAGLRAPRRLEVVPYVASRIGREPGVAADPFYASTDVAPRVGADVKVGVTGDLTLSATVNPDFGQVEADPARVNLSQFELFFPERRPFFLEGTDVFSFGQVGYSQIVQSVDYLYTRRIGRSPQRTGFVPGEAYDAGTVYTDTPRQTTILGAAKLSGRVGRFSVGVLDAVTAPETGLYTAVDATGALAAEGEELVEPLSNYLVGRVRGTFGRTDVGALLTSTLRDAGDPGIASLLPSSATVSGVDIEHDLGRQWAFGAVVSGSVSTGDAAAIGGLQRSSARYFGRPDADHVAYDPTRTALGGVAGGFTLAKQGGSTQGALQFYSVSPGFDANAVGYQSVADYHRLSANVSRRWSEPAGPFRSRYLGAFSIAGWNYGGAMTDAIVGFNGSATFTNSWYAGFNVNAMPRTVSDRLTRGGPLAGYPATVAAGVSASTDRRRVVSVSPNGFIQLNELGGWYSTGAVSVDVRPSPALALSVGARHTRQLSALQYVTSLGAPEVATFGRRYVFAELDQTTTSLDLGLDWTFSPALTLQLYAAPYVSAGAYDRYRELAAPGALDYPVYGEVRGSVERNEGTVQVDPGDGGDSFSFLDPGFTFRSLQGNAVLRWEYRPGSTLFLVWQQQRDGYDRGLVDRALRRNADFLLDTPPSNVFLVKLSYWLG